MVFAIRVKLANVAAVQRPHDPNAREHRRSARRRDHDQGFHCRLPLRSLVLGLRKLRDVIAGILERDKLTAARQRNRIIKRSISIS
jgi:hypothetical protein